MFVFSEKVKNWKRAEKLPEMHSKDLYILHLHLIILTICPYLLLFFLLSLSKRIDSYIRVYAHT